LRSVSIVVDERGVFDGHDDRNTTSGLPPIGRAAGWARSVGQPLGVWPRRIGIAAAVLVCAAGASWKAREYYVQRANKLRAARAAAAVAPAGPHLGRLQIESNPQGATIIVDGTAHGITPSTIEGVSVGSHVVELKGDGGSVRRTVAVAADQTVQLSEAIFAGWAHVSSPIELTISEGGRALSPDDKSQVMLPAGPHELQFENRDLHYRAFRRVDIKPGGVAPISVVPPASAISVTATSEAEVLIDGERAGTTPLTDHPVSIGTRDILVRLPSGAERRLTVTVTTTPAHVDVDFASP
jgi:hypothetical protein